jgi:hypothetical protein
MTMAPPKAMTPGRAWTCVLINQLATPGFGSIAGGRRIVGTCQLIVALAGFVLLTGWMFHYFYQLSMGDLETWTPDKSYAWLGKWGLICFAAGWFWALATSISLLRQAKAEQPAVPPRM